MSRYYFDVFDGRLHRDDTGQDLPDIARVVVEARRTLADMVVRGSGPLGAVLTVRGDDSRTVLTASLSLHVDTPDTEH